MPDLDFTIRTKAELAGAETTAEALEMQIGKAKALGRDYSGLSAQLNKVQSALEGVNPALRKNSEEAEHLHLSHRGLHVLFTELGQQSVPALGHALAGALYGPIGWAIALGAAIRGIQEASEQAAEAQKRLDDAMSIGDTEGVTSAAGNYAGLLAKQSIAADDYAAALEKIKTAQAEIKTQTDDQIKALGAEKTAWNEVQKSELDAAKADIEAQAERGEISPEEKIQRLAQLEDAAATERSKKSKEFRDRELAARQSELTQTKAAAQVVDAGVSKLESDSNIAEENEVRRPAMIKSLEDQIKELKHQNEKITDEIGLPGLGQKTAISDQVPWNKDWAVPREQVVNNEATIAQLKATLDKISSVAEIVAAKREAHRAEKKLEQGEASSEKLNQRVKDLEKIVADLSQQNALADKTETTVTANEQHARDTRAGAQISKEQDATIQRDLDVINNFTKHPSINPETTAKVAAALSEINSLLDNHMELMAQVLALGGSRKQLNDVAAELVQVRQIAEQARDQHHY